MDNSLSQNSGDGFAARALARLPIAVGDKAILIGEATSHLTAVHRDDGGIERVAIAGGRRSRH